MNTKMSTDGFVLALLLYTTVQTVTTALNSSFYLLLVKTGFLSKCTPATYVIFSPRVINTSVTFRRDLILSLHTVKWASLGGGNTFEKMYPITMCLSGEGYVQIWCTATPASLQFLQNQAVTGGER